MKEKISNEEKLLKVYDLLVNLYIFEQNQFNQRFSLFLILNSGLLAFYNYAKGPLGTYVFPCLGIVICLAFIYIFRRMLIFVQFWYSRLILLEKELLGEDMLKNDLGIFEMRRRFLYTKNGVKAIRTNGVLFNLVMPRWLKFPVSQIISYVIPSFFIIIWMILVIFFR
jgi:hypothetical protein